MYTNLSMAVVQMVSVFHNAVLFHEKFKDSEYAQRIIPRCQHLVQYVRWLCHETIPLSELTDSVKKAKFPEVSGLLSLEQRDVERKSRMDLLARPAQRTLQMSKACNALLTELYSKASKPAAERKLYDIFCV